MIKDNSDDKSYSQQEALELVKQYENVRKNNQNYFFEHESLEDIIDFYEENSQWDKAYEAANFAAAQHPGSATFLAKKAQFLFEQKKFTPALALIEQALLLSPTDMDALVLQADIYNQLGNHARALQILKSARLFADREDKSDIYIVASDVYESWGKPEKAYACAKKALRLCPESEMAQMRYDYIAIETGHFKESIQIQNKLINANPYSHLAWYHLGNAWFGLERYRKAINAYEYAVAINETFIPAHRDLGEAWFELGNYARAKQYYLETQKLGETDDELVYSMGLCDLYMDNYTDAEHSFGHAIELNPAHTDAYYQLSECLKLKHEYAAALKKCKIALHFEPKNDTYLYAVADLSCLLGDYEAGLLYFLEAIHANKEEPVYWLKAAAVYFQLEQYHEGEEILEMAISKFPHRADLCYLLAAFIYERGKKQSAYLYLSRALQIDKDGIELFLSLMPHLAADPNIQLLIDLSNLTDN
ncbi:tetratricopeptide repeat protein [Sphingobacteriales bacterium UPWRP_1]|nr:hypothetical protein BVG80_14420 [Sphingobacteriales bacterium TSM_CSM]PSJ76594.1 tetratricopeptide repeat protein [Sphingobacteriales bacterium UPWRP_1]